VSGGLSTGSDERDTRVGTVLMLVSGMVPLAHIVGKDPTAWMTALAYFGALVGGALLGGARQRQIVRDEVRDHA